MTWNSTSGRGVVPGRRARVHWFAVGAAAIACAASITACNTDQLLNVKAPDRIPAETLNDPSQASLLVNGTVADFECAYAAYALIEATISDEFADAQLAAAAWGYDRRDFNAQPGGIYGTNSCAFNQTPGIYVPLSTARWDADNALTKLQGWTDEQVGTKRTSLIATAALYAGFSYASMGMSFCEAAFDLEAPIDQQAMFARAEDRFTTAINAATQVGGMTSILNAAYAGRARVRLFQGNTDGAISDAQQVPAGFVFNATYDGNDNRRFNRVFASTTQFGLYTVDPQSRHLMTGPFLVEQNTAGEVLDPRSHVDSIPRLAADPLQTIWSPTKYAAGDGAPIRVASWDEAQLILAEAKGGSDAVPFINAVRSAYGLPLYVGASDAASITQLIVDERLRTLFAEGFRNYDIQRFSLPLIPAPGTSFRRGGTYGNTTCLPLPNIERFNNPNVPPEG